MNTPEPKSTECKHHFVRDDEHPTYHCCQLCGKVLREVESSLKTRGGIEPPGWKLVPIEPTQAMVDAWSSALSFPKEQSEWMKLTDAEKDRAVASADWKAMIEAAPSERPAAPAPSREQELVWALEKIAAEAVVYPEYMDGYAGMAIVTAREALKAYREARSLLGQDSAAPSGENGNG
jgi:hypothetical protein